MSKILKQGIWWSQKSTTMSRPPRVLYFFLTNRIEIRLWHCSQPTAMLIGNAAGWSGSEKGLWGHRYWNQMRLSTMAPPRDGASGRAGAVPFLRSGWVDDPFNLASCGWMNPFCMRGDMCQLLLSYGWSFNPRSPTVSAAIFWLCGQQLFVRGCWCCGTFTKCLLFCIWLGRSVCGEHLFRMQGSDKWLME